MHRSFLRNPLNRCIFGILIVIICQGVSADDARPVTTRTGDVILFKGVDLTGWREPHGIWRVVESVVLAPETPQNFRSVPGKGVLLNNPEGHSVDLLTEAEFGDVEVHVEFNITRHSNSGVYLQGRYEVQIYDSYGVEKDEYPGIECGGIYPRWIDDHGVNGHSPRVNASKPAGEWQSFDIIFRAPRFDQNRRKLENARIIRVTHNGQVVQEDVDLTGPTRSARWDDEKPEGPLLLQGDHGPVAFRNLKIKRLRLH